MPTHFDDAESGEPLAIETHVHLLSDHVAAGLGAGFALAELRERVIDDEWIALKPKWERHRDHPISFAFAWSRSSTVLGLVFRAPREWRAENFEGKEFAWSTASSGSQGWRSAAIGLGTMGMTMAYGPGGDEDERASPPSAVRTTSASPSSTPPSCTAWAPAPTSSSSARPSNGFRDEVVIATKFGFDLSDPTSRPGLRQPARAHPRGHREQPAPPRHRPHRRALPAPRRPGRADRGRRRHGRRADRRGQGPVLRPQRGRPGDDPPGPRRAPGLGAADRVLDLRARRRGRRSCRCSRSSASASSPTRRSAAASSPATSSRQRVPRRRHAPLRPALAARATTRSNAAAIAALTALAAEQGDQGHPARARLAARPGGRHRPDPRHPQPRAARGERRRRRRRLTDADLDGSARSCRTAPSVTATPPG